MALFSTEQATYKSWLIANISLWGWVPALLISLGINSLSVYVMEEQTPMGALALYCMFWVIFLFRVDYEFGKLPLGHIVVLLASGCFLYYFLFVDGQSDNGAKFEFSTFAKIWMLVSYLLSLFLAKGPAQYAYTYFDDVVSRSFRFRTSKVDQHSMRLQYTFNRFVEAFYFIFVVLSAFASFL